MNACFDTNRMSLPTQRMAHAEWMRSTRRRVWITPMTAEELAPLVDIDYLRESRKRIVEELAREGKKNQPSAGRTKRLIVNWWWARQWAMEDGTFAARLLDREEEERADQVRKEIPLGVFPGRTRSDLETDHDAIIVSEVVACRGQMLVTGNMASVDHDRANSWCLENHERFGLAAEDPLREADPAMRQWADRNPDEAVRILLRCALPPEGTRDKEEAKRLVNRHVHAMAEAKLAQTALKARNIFAADPENERVLEEAMVEMPTHIRMEEEKMREALRTEGRSILAEETCIEDHERPQQPRGA